MIRSNFLLSLGIIFVLIIGCKVDPKNAQSTYQNSYTFSPGQEDEIRAAFIGLEDNSEIILKEGTYHFEKLSIQGPLNQISVRGEGPDKTIIDFSGQASGGEGFRVDNVNGFSIKDIRIQESAGDLIKVKNGKNVEFVNLHTVWDGEPEITNGGYGIYPVLCENVLIDNCYARGASDAGIYVGQTINATVKNNLVEYCVAGIEIENTITAEVYENEMTNNTGGLLIFDHPGLKYDGKDTRAYNNYIHHNNYKNFAPAANNATGVGNVAPGTGVLILRTSDVEVFENKIEDNNTMSIGIVSYVTVEPTILETRPDYDPIPKNVSVHDNQISKQAEFPDPAFEHELAQIIIQLHGKLKEIDPASHTSVQHILYDGVVMGEGLNPSNICISEASSTTFLNLDAGNQFSNPGTDLSRYSCQ